MATTTNVLTGLSTPVVYRQWGDKMGFLVSSRSKPRILLPGNRGYYMGLHDVTWFNVPARPSGTATYYVQIVPMWSEISDLDGNPLMGTANAENGTKGTTFNFDPFPDNYACNGYRVYAGTTSGILYYQGELTGRWNTTFTIGSTWSYNSTGVNLVGQTFGPPSFAHAIEVYENEGEQSTRVFLGGGIRYTDGYAKIATSTSSPSLVCGAMGNISGGDVTPWTNIANGSFRMMLGWVESTLKYEQTFDFTGINLLADGSVNAIATRLQSTIRAAIHPALYCGTGATTTVATWTAITNGSFDIWVDGVIKHVVSVDFTGDTTMDDVAGSIQTAMQALGGSMAAATCVWDTGASVFVVKANSGSATAESLLSYLYPNSAGTGTDISSMMKGLETSTGVFLVRRGKAATTAQSVAYSTDHFVITSTDTGIQARLGYLSAASIGTDISGVSWMNGLSTSVGSLYTPGMTVGTTLVGDGTKWGDWAEGMRVFLGGESGDEVVDRVVSEDLIELESTYSGTAGFSGFTDYVLAPKSDRIYVSEVGNPFKFENSEGYDTSIACSTPDGDEINAIRRNGPNISVFMDHHIWTFDGVSIGNPKMISEAFGAPNTASCVESSAGLCVFTGGDFVIVQGTTIQRLDPDGRMKQYLERISSNFSNYHGVYDDSEGKELIKWFVGLDSSYYANTALVYEPSSGNWWIHNVKDASASCMIRNSINEKYLVTGSTYDDGHAIKAFLNMWSSDYKSDGAVASSSYDKSGIINTVGSATTTAGYLTCGTSGASLAQYQAVTAGYFGVTIDDNYWEVGPINLSTAADLAGVATLLQVAIRAVTGGSEVVAYASNYFKITSGTTTSRSNVGYLVPNRPVSTMTDLSSKSYLNGRENHATKTYAVTQRVLNLYNWSSSDANVYATGTSEEGVWVYVCDTNFRNGQYARVVSNTATAITVTPNFSTTPAAGWYWYIGGIVPSWTKWLDWGSPHHKNKIHGIAITAPNSDSTTGNVLAVHTMQDLDSTIRVTKKISIGDTADTTQAVYPADQPCTQFGLKLQRPSSEFDLKIDDITIAHRSRV